MEWDQDLVDAHEKGQSRMEAGRVGRLFKWGKYHGIQPELLLLFPSSFLPPTIHLQALEDLPPKHIPVSPLFCFYYHPNPSHCHLVAFVMAVGVMLDVVMVLMMMVICWLC